MIGNKLQSIKLLNMVNLIGCVDTLRGKYSNIPFYFSPFLIYIFFKLNIIIAYMYFVYCILFKLLFIFIMSILNSVLLLPHCL